MMIEPERQVNHVRLFGTHFGATTEVGEEMADVAVVPFDVLCVLLALDS
jgi:hypothetical protein